MSQQVEWFYKEHAELLAMVREVAGLEAEIDGPNSPCHFCGMLPCEGGHAPDCLWLRAQKFREKNDG